MVHYKKKKISLCKLLVLPKLSFMTEIISQAPTLTLPYSNTGTLQTENQVKVSNDCRKLNADPANNAAFKGLHCNSDS